MVAWWCLKTFLPFIADQGILYSAAVPAQVPTDAAPADRPRPMTMAERLAAAAARVPEEDLPLGTKPKAGGKKAKKGKKGEEGAATALTATAPPPSAPVRGICMLC